MFYKRFPGILARGGETQILLIPIILQGTNHREFRESVHVPSCQQRGKLKKIMALGMSVQNRACSKTAYCWHPLPLTSPITTTPLNCLVSTVSQQGEQLPMEENPERPEALVSKVRCEVISCLSKQEILPKRLCPLASFKKNLY